MIDLSLGLVPVMVGLGGAAGAVGLLAAHRLQPKSMLARAAGILGTVCLLLTAVAWTSRLLAAGHLPLFGTYESAWSLALASLLAAALAARRSAAPAVWGIASIVAAVLVADGTRYETALYPLTISERSWVVDVHALFAWLAFAVFVVALGLALSRLVARREEEHIEADATLALTLRTAFVLHTAMLATGSFYKFLLFGTVWSFDPVETLGFAAWVAYGTLLHLHLLGGWSGRRLARWSLGLFLLLVVSYRGLVHFPSWSTYHVFDMNLRSHIVE